MLAKSHIEGKPFMTLKIRIWILLAAATVLAPMVGVLAYGLHRLDTAERALIDAEVRTRAQGLVRAVEARLATAQEALQTLATSSAAHNGDWPALRDSAERLLLAQPHYAGVQLVDLRGTVRFDTARPASDPAPDRSVPIDAVHNVFQTGRATLSGPDSASAEAPLAVAMSVPVYGDTDVSHLLRMSLRCDSLSQLIQEQRLPEGWIASVANREGILVARSLDAENALGEPASASLRAAMARNTGDITGGTTREGIPVTLQVLPIRGGEWFASIAVADALVAQRYRHNMTVVGAAFLGIGALGIFVALWISRFLARQALALENTVASGRPDTASVWPLRIAELKQVDAAFRAMSRRERQTQHDLVSVTHEKDEVSDLYEYAPCGYHSLDPQGLVVRINRTELEWLGRTREEVLGRSMTDFFTDEGRARFRVIYPEFLSSGHVENVEFDLVRKDGSTFPVLISATLLRNADGQPRMSRSTVFDITERKKLEQQLEALSRTDPLTGLHNRRRFYELAALELERARRHARPLAVAMLDIDHFKAVNDTHGHATGDRVLRSLADVSQTQLRQLDVIARYGGEEFAVLLPETEVEIAIQVLERLRGTLAAAAVQSDTGAEVRCTVSIGVTALHPDDPHVDTALKRADAALYEAKRLGRNQLRVG